MREFVVKARKAPVDADRFLGAVGSGPRVEFLARIMADALLISKGHRDDTRLTLVLEDSPDYSRSVIFDGSMLGELAGTDESGLLLTCASALRDATGMGRDESICCDNGIMVRTISFEHLVKEKLGTGAVYVLDRKGKDIRDLAWQTDPVFVLTDHIPMPRKTRKSLTRLGMIEISLGPVMLHASQCISLIHNELDRHGVV